MVRCDTSEELEMEVALLIIAAALNYLGLSYLAMSQNRHWKAITATSHYPSEEQRFVLRVWGYGLTLLSLAFMIGIYELSFGALSWVMLQAPLAIAASFTISGRPRSLMPAAKVALVFKPKPNARRPNSSD